MKYKVLLPESPYYGQVLELAFKWDDHETHCIPGYYSLHRPEGYGTYNIDVEWLEPQ